MRLLVIIFSCLFVVACVQASPRTDVGSVVQPVEGSSPPVVDVPEGTVPYASEVPEGTFPPVAEGTVPPPVVPDGSALPSAACCPALGAPCGDGQTTTTATCVGTSTGLACMYQCVDVKGRSCLPLFSVTDECDNPCPPSDSFDCDAFLMP